MNAQAAQSLLDQTAQKFLEFDYKEVKDLSIEFLRLTSGILALSITFSEKVAKNASAKIFLVISWFWFIVALVASGLALASMFNAALQAKHSERTVLMWGSFQGWGNFSYLVLQWAGAAFVAGLICLMVSGIAGYKTQRPT